MIFEHLFSDNFCKNFLSHTHITFTLSLYCYGFRANTIFFFVKYDCQISCHQIDCSNNTPLSNI